MPPGATALSGLGNSMQSTSRPNTVSAVFQLKAALSPPHSSVNFLIDSGAAFSLLPISFTPTAPSSSLPSLFTASGQPLQILGTTKLTFSFPNFPNKFVWNFLIANVQSPILGSDFLAAYDLLVDCKFGRLLNRSRNTSTENCLTHATDDISSPPCINNKEKICTITKVQPKSILKHHTKPNVCTCDVSRSSPSAVTKSNDQAEPFLTLDANLKNYISTSCPNILAKDPHVQPQANTYHHIVTLHERPIKQKVRPLSPQRRKAVEQEFNDLEKAGIIRRSKSPWASPLHVVTKKDGSFRPCGDYRQLNNLTIMDAYPLPLINDILHRLHGTTLFSSIDLHKAYHQIPVAPADILKTAVITPFGLFEYLYMPFGLRSASQTFQRHIDTVLAGLDFAFPYIDDILIASSSPKQHDEHLRIVFNRLHKNNMQVNFSKCYFFQKRINFLGHIITPFGHSPQPDRLQQLKNISLPTTTTDMRSFLGTLHFIHKYVPHCSELTAPFAQLSSGKKKQRIQWTSELINHFDHLREGLKTVEILAYPKPNAHLVLTTDASTTAIGAILHQIHNGTDEPLEFYSRKLSPPESRYSTFDRELLAIVLAVKHFKHLLLSRQFTVQTDHKPLLHIMSLKTPSPRQERQISYLSTFSFVIKHISGTDNLVADFLSRSVSSIMVKPLFSTEILQANQPSADILKTFKSFTCIDGIAYDTSNPANKKIILAPALQKPAFLNTHSLHHPGSKTTFRLLQRNVVWPSMRTDVQGWVKECVACQKYKVARHLKPPLFHFPCTSRFETIHLDLVGPLPIDNGYQYILTMMDRASRWPEAVPLRSTNTDSVADAFIKIWITRFGSPRRIITDQGPQFESNLFKSLIKHLGIAHFHTTPYHPQANGLLERFHRTMKTSLRILADGHSNWTTLLPFVMLGWRNTPSTTTGCAPAEALFGTPIRALFELTDLDNTPTDETIHIAQTHFVEVNADSFCRLLNNDKAYIPTDLFSAKFVWLKDQSPSGFRPPYVGPYKLLQLSSHTATILRNDKPYNVHISNIKPAFFVDDEQNSSPPAASLPTASSETSSNFLNDFDQPQQLPLLNNQSSTLPPLISSPFTSSSPPSSLSSSQQLIFPSTLPSTSPFSSQASLPSPVLPDFLSYPSTTHSSTSTQQPSFSAPSSPSSSFAETSPSTSLHTPHSTPFFPQPPQQGDTSVKARKTVTFTQYSRIKSIDGTQRLVHTKTH